MCRNRYYLLVALLWECSCCVFIGGNVVYMSRENICSISCHVTRSVSLLYCCLARLEHTMDSLIRTVSPLAVPPQKQQCTYSDQSLPSGACIGCFPLHQRYVFSAVHRNPVQKTLPIISPDEDPRVPSITSMSIDLDKETDSEFPLRIGDKVKHLNIAAAALGDDALYFLFANLLALPYEDDSWTAAYISHDVTSGEVKVVLFEEPLTAIAITWHLVWKVVS